MDLCVSPPRCLLWVVLCGLCHSLIYHYIDVLYSPGRVGGEAVGHGSPSAGHGERRDGKYVHIAAEGLVSEPDRKSCNTNVCNISSWPSALPFPTLMLHILLYRIMCC